MKTNSKNRKENIPVFPQVRVKTWTVHDQNLTLQLDTVVQVEREGQQYATVVRVSRMFEGQIELEKAMEELDLLRQQVDLVKQGKPADSELIFGLN